MHKSYDDCFTACPKDLFGSLARRDAIVRTLSIVIT